MKTLLVSFDDDLLRELIHRVHGEVDLLMRANDERDMRHEVYTLQPGIIVLDLRFGGQRFYALSSVLQLVLMANAPSVILLAPAATKDFIAGASEMGCHGVVDLSRRTWARDVERTWTTARSLRRAGHRTSPQLLRSSLQ